MFTQQKHLFFRSTRNDLYFTYFNTYVFEEISFLFFRLFNFVVCTDDDFICGWWFIPADETMSSSKNESVMNDWAITELTITSESFVWKHDNMWIFSVNRWTTWNVWFSSSSSHLIIIILSLKPVTLGFLRVVYSEFSYLETSRDYDRCDDPLVSILE